jgi:hypothetical protein
LPHATIIGRIGAIPLPTGAAEPITDIIEAEFDGDKAKLEWPVSTDGKKKQNETYKIIGILTKITAPNK